MENGKNTSMNLSRELPYQKTHPLGDAAFSADCLTSLRILQIVIVCLKNGFWQCYQELLHVEKVITF